MTNKNTLKLAVFLVFSLVFTVSGFVSAEEGTVAGAGTYSDDSTPTPEPSTEIIINIPSSTPSRSPEISSAPVVKQTEEGFFKWILGSSVLWVGLTLLVAIIVTIYLRRRKKDSTPSV